MVAFTVETEELAGFGTWKIRRDVLLADQEEPASVIDVPFFGLDQRFHGEVDHEGRKLAGRLFATIEAVARMSPDVGDDMPMHLVCDVRNDRGLAFWRGRGFQDVEQLHFPEVSYIRMLRS